MRKLLYITLLGVLGCACTQKEEIEEDPYKGTDNFLYAFSLRVGTETYRAALTDCTITISLPLDASLTGAAASYELSEKATITPDPASVSSWGEPMDFTVESYSGSTRTYSYSVIQAPQIHEGDITLKTQAEVDAFADSGVSVISGSLILGTKNGEAIADLSGLKNLVEVSGTIDFVSCDGIEKIDLPHLESIGNIYLKTSPLRNLKTIDLPELKHVTHNFYIPIFVESKLNALEYVGGDLALCGIWSEESLQSLRKCNGELYLNCQMEEAVFPELEYAGAIKIMRAQQIGFPKLTRTGDIETLAGECSFPVLEKCVSINLRNKKGIKELPALKEVAGSLTLGADCKCPLITKIDGSITGGVYPLLESVGGDLTNATCDLLTSAPKDVSYCFCPILSSVGGLLTCYTYSDLLTDYPSLYETEGIVIAPENKTENSLAVWDFTKYEIGASGIGIHISYPKFAAPEKIVGLDEFPGTLSLYFGSQKLSEIEGFRKVGALSVACMAYSAQENYPIILPSVQEVEGDCTLNARRVVMAQLKSIGSHLNVQADYISMPVLNKIGKRFTCDGFNNANRIGEESFVLDFPLLSEVGDNTVSGSRICFYICDYTVQELIFPELQAVHGRIVIGGEGNEYPNHTLLESISMPKLHTVEGSLVIGIARTYFEGSVLSKLNFPSLTSVSGISITRQPQLYDFSTFAQIVKSLKASMWTVNGCGYNPLWQDMIDGKWNGE